MTPSSAQWRTRNLLQRTAVGLAVGAAVSVSGCGSEPADHHTDASSAAITADGGAADGALGADGSALDGATSGGDGSLPADANTTTTDDGSVKADGSAPEDASTTADSSAPDAAIAGPVNCTVTPVVFPSFSKACNDPSQCAYGLQPVDCCGARRAIGLRADALADFNKAAQKCTNELPACGCFSEAVTTDDGASKKGQVESSIRVQCVAGMCGSSFSP